MYRFRTYFPEDYKRLYPNATSTRERVTPQNVASDAASFSKAKRKERTPFTKQEDENLLIGFGKYGGKWSSIQKDDSLGLSHRRSTDLRDRFRNAYPEKYVGAGFKPPPSKRRRRNPEVNPSNINSRPAQRAFGFHNDLVPTHSSLTSTAIPKSEATIPTPVRRDQAVAAMTISQPTADTFSHARLGWTNAHTAAAQEEREMALKIRRALDMSNPELMTEIPLDPGLSDVSYQPHDENQNDGDALTGLLDAAVHNTTWKRE
jgi:Myb-like DNA-binding domain